MGLMLGFKIGGHKLANVVIWRGLSVKALQ